MEKNNYFTLTKRELLARLAHLDDSERIYIQTTRDDIRAAEGRAAREDAVLTFGITRDVVNEADGASIVVYFPK